MKPINRRLFVARWLAIALVVFATLSSLSVTTSASGTPQTSAACQSIDLDQGWNQSQREDFWFTSQGSRLMPYTWFLALEVGAPTSQILFHDRANMDRYGYIAAPASARNPDGLPIGFARDHQGKPADDHIGFTCAACHTGSVNIAGTRVIVEGGPALADFWTFLTDVTAALALNLNDHAKFDRFAKKVLNTPNPPVAAANDLRARMKVKLLDLQTRVDQSGVTNPAGNGREEAFGHIFTRVLAQSFGMPANAKPPYGPAVSAPASYPFLWDTPQHDVVQWNGSAPNLRLFSLGPLGRNVGEVLGVFGELDVSRGHHILFLPFLPRRPHIDASADIGALKHLESLVTQLWSPKWPKDCLPLANADTLAHGQAVYSQACAQCHRLIGKDERTDPRRQIDAVLKPVGDVGTDPTLATNFVERKALTGPLEGAGNLSHWLGKFGPEGKGQELLLAVVNGVMVRSGLSLLELSGPVSLRADRTAFDKAMEAGRTARYKARPLNGIWATAPYLHNGSVPTLYDLLNPVDQRPAVFYVGSREFDAKQVGLDTTEVPGAFRFDTAPMGNLRSGHLFGTTLSAKDKEDLLEFLKTL